MSLIFSSPFKILKLIKQCFTHKRLKRFLQTILSLNNMLYPAHNQHTTLSCFYKTLTDYLFLMSSAIFI